MQNRVTPQQANAYYHECAAALESIDESLDHAHALIQSITGTIAWESFSPEQRAALAEWGRYVSEARSTLRLPNV